MRPTEIQGDERMLTQVRRTRALLADNLLQRPLKREKPRGLRYLRVRLVSFYADSIYPVNECLERWKVKT